MKLHFRRFLLIGVSLFASLQHSIADEFTRIAVVASYSNTIEQEKTVGARVASILHANGTERMTITGRNAISVFIAVAPDHATEARLLLAQAIKAEQLQLNLLVREGNNLCAVITPDRILESKKDQRAE